MSDTETSADEINHDMETEEESAADTEEEATDEDKQDASPKLKKSPLVPKKAKQASKKVAMSAAKVAPSGDAKKSKKTYEEMVLHAVKELKSRSGSSRAAILSYMKGTYHLEAEDKIIGFHVSASIKRGLAKGHLKHATDSGKGKNCFKLDEKGSELMKKAAATDKAKSKPKPKSKKVEKKKTPAKASGPSSSKPKAKSKKEVVPTLKKTSSITTQNKLKASASRRASVGTPVRVKKVESKVTRSRSGSKNEAVKDTAVAKSKETSKKSSKETDKKDSSKASGKSKKGDTKENPTKGKGSAKKAPPQSPKAKAKPAAKKKASKK